MKKERTEEEYALILNTTAVKGAYEHPTPDVAWACAGIDPDVFFPADDDESGRGGRDLRRLRRAGLAPHDRHGSGRVRGLGRCPPGRGHAPERRQASGARPPTGGRRLTAPAARERDSRSQQPPTLVVQGTRRRPTKPETEVRFLPRVLCPWCSGSIPPCDGGGAGSNPVGHPSLQ